MGKKAFDIVGAIDVGSHYLHMTIAQVNENGQVIILEDLTKPTNIGIDTFTLGRIATSTMRDTVEALKGFALVLRDYKVKIYKAIATSAFREAENREYVLEQIRLKTGLSVEVINSAQERFFMYKALRYQSPELKLTHPEESALIINIASGGVEVSIYDRGSLKLTEYVKIGALRLRETLADLQNKTTNFSQVMEEYIDSKLSLIKPMINNTTIKYFIGLGSELNTIFRLIRRNDLHIMDSEDITNLYEKVRVMLDEQLRDTFDLHPRQIETFLPSVIILNSFLKMTKTKRVYIPMVELRQGILEDLSDRIYDHPRRVEYMKDIVSSVWYIAKKYGVDRQHSSQVAKLALSIFDQTKKLHKLGEMERLYLQIAAILHTIGYFVSFSDHHFFSYELIKKQNIMGLANAELDLIANIILYHEGEVPRQSHRNYQGLIVEAKITVSKLAAILKLADSLDISRGKKIEKVEIIFAGEELQFKLSAKQNILLEEWSFAQRMIFFEEVMGMRPRIKRKV